MRVRSGASDEKKQSVVEAWYREQLKQAVPALIAKWEPLVGVKVERFFVQRMKTKWGSCNPGSGVDQFMPNWRICRPELNRLPVRHEDWDY